MLRSIAVFLCALAPVVNVHAMMNAEDVQPTDPLSRTTVMLDIIQDDGSPATCTAEILNDQYLLTAEHCIWHFKSGKVFYSVNRNGLIPGANIRKIKQTIGGFSADYPSVAMYGNYDVALIEMEPGKTPTGYAPVKILNPDSDAIAPGALVSYAGYGLTEAGTYDRLKKVSVLLAGGDSRGGYSTDAKGVCEGDSGGPGYINVNGEWYLWGVISAGDAECKGLSILNRIDGNFLTKLKTYAPDLKTN